MNRSQLDLALAVRLGRGAIVTGEDKVPGHLTDAPMVEITPGTLTTQAHQTADRLHTLWGERTPVVIRLYVDPSELRDDETSDKPVYAVPPTFLFPLERLRYLIWANNVDWRNSDNPTWWHTTKACRANPTLKPSSVADVVLPDGRDAVVDGGPRDRIAADGFPFVVVHRDDTERGIVHLGKGGGKDGTENQITAQATAHLAGLADDQAAAATAAAGAVRVAAPAGSGKTRVLTARLADLLGPRRTPSRSVVALAYNTEAANELRERVNDTAVIATIHAYALALLRRHIGDVSVLDDRDVRRILGRIVDVPRKASTDPLAPYIDALAQVRTALVAPEKVDEKVEDVTEFADVFAAYRTHLHRTNTVDFPEMVYRATELLLTDPAVRHAEQARVGHVLVDEFQDLTPAYVLFVRLLASPQLHCFGVGDDDQVIYGHAGATPQFLLDFTRLFPGAADHPLVTNYRCPAAVVTAASKLLEHNTQRLDKTIAAAPAASTEPLDVVTTPIVEQAVAAGDRIEKVLAERRPDGTERSYSDVVVLARTKVALLGVQADLTRRKIPTTSPIGPWLLDRTTVAAALSYLRIATEPAMPGDDLAAILHRPLRRIPSSIRDVFQRREWSIADLARFADDAEGGVGRALRDFARDMTLLRTRAERQPTTEVLRFLTDVIGLGDVAEHLDHSAGDRIGTSHIDDLQALLQVADHCPEPGRFEEFLRGVVSAPNHDVDAIRLSTIHSVKGLEWPVVFIVGAAEGITPHRLSVTPEELEEERRVFHVALTRASERATIVAPRSGTSRFVAEAQGKPSLIGTVAAPRPSVAKAKTAVTKKATKKKKKQDRPRYRASVGLSISAFGGLSGVVESVTDVGALIRTQRGSLVQIKYGSSVRIDGVFGTLVAE